MSSCCSVIFASPLCHFFPSIDTLGLNSFHTYHLSYSLFLKPISLRLTKYNREYFKTRNALFHLGKKSEYILQSKFQTTLKWPDLHCFIWERKGVMLGQSHFIRMMKWSQEVSLPLDAVTSLFLFSIPFIFLENNEENWTCFFNWRSPQFPSICLFQSHFDSFFRIKDFVNQ